MSIYLRTEKIISDWTDYNGHMNLAFYIHLFDQGWDVLLDRFQMGGESAKNEKRSTFAVESHTKYIQEVKEGDEVDINLLFLDRDKKRFVYQLEIVSKSGNFRAATSEVCSLYVDLSIRKVIEMEDHKLKLVDDFIAEYKNQFSPIEFYLLDKLKKKNNNKPFYNISFNEGIELNQIEIISSKKIDYFVFCFQNT